MALIPTAAIIIIGNEILSGRTQDTNIQFLALELGKLGIDLNEVRIIPDILEEIIDSVNVLRNKYNYVFTTGGIGPTHDDITVEALAKAFGTKLELNEQALQLLNQYYAEGELNDARKKMAFIPVGAKLIKNPVSNAPGVNMDNVYVMAGVPNIMQAMFNQLKSTLKTGTLSKSKTITVHTGESMIAKLFADLQHKYSEINMGSYPFTINGKYGTDLVLRGRDIELLNKSYQELKTQLLSLNIPITEQEEE